MNLKEYLEFKLPKKKWVTISVSELDNELKEKLWEMYKKTYGELGIISHSSIDSVIKDSSKLVWFIDVDEDPLPDAFIIYKEKSAANKINLLGTDGSDIAKKALLQKLFELLNSGFVVEASVSKATKLRDIIKSKNIPIIKDEKTVKKIASSNIKNLDKEGIFVRLNNIGEEMQKQIFGTLK